MNRPNHDPQHDRGEPYMYDDEDRFEDDRSVAIVSALILAMVAVCAGGIVAFCAHMSGLPAWVSVSAGVLVAAVALKRWIA